MTDHRLQVATDPGGAGGILLYCDGCSWSVNLPDALPLADLMKSTSSHPMEVLPERVLVDPSNLRIAKVLHLAPEGAHAPEDCPGDGPWPCGPLRP